MKPIFAIVAPPLSALSLAAPVLAPLSLAVLFLTPLLLSGCATTPPMIPMDPSATAARGQDAAASDLTGRTLGARLYDQLRSGDDNVVVSPISLMGAFGVVASGARGETRTAVLSSLGLPDSPTLDADLGAQLRDLERNEGPTILSIANAVWVRQDFTLNPAFVQGVERDYGAYARPLDFQNDPEGSAGRINAWVAAETRQRIPQLISPSSLNDATRLIVTNAVYFLGDWRRPFSASNTDDQPFHLADGSTLLTPLMYQRGAFRLLETDGFQAIDLPYADERLSMTVLLPREYDGLPNLEAGLAADLSGWLNQLDAQPPQTVRLYLPKTEMALSYELVPPLTALGMGVAFGGDADFRGIADAPLAIGQVVHKTFLRIDEKGAEAAAATGVVIELTSAPAAPPPTFRADHPFLFLIRDRATGAVLFHGRIARPESLAG